MLRDLAIAVSLANVFFFKWWIELLDLAVPYHAQDWPFHTQYTAMMLNVVGIGTACSAAVTFARRAKSVRALQIARLVFLIVMLVGLPYQFLRVPDLSVMRLSFRDMLGLSDSVGLVGPLILHVLWLGLVVLFITRWPRLVTKFLTLSLLVLSPVVLVSLARATSLWIDPHSALSDAPNAAFLNTKTPRVVWVVLDEFDQRIGFEDRPPDLRMPAFDRLRDEAVYASDAYPPAGATLRSMPAFSTGRFVSEAEKIRPDELRLSFGDGNGNAQETGGWSTTPSIFTRVRELGGDSAIVGMYHPYCRILGSQVADCLAIAYGLRPLIARDSSIWDAMGLQLCRLTKNYPVLYRCESSTLRAEMGKSLDLLVARARQQIRDARFDLLFFHLVVPHLPGVYDRETLSMSDSVANNYLDNLELADRVIAALRKELEDAGAWEETTFIVTSDHSLRIKTWRERITWTEEEERIIGSTQDPRVPLFVKFPGQTSGRELTEPVNGVVLHDLVVAVASGEVADTAEGLSWLNKATGLGLSPYH